ncbi:MAG: winged helix-turn-helix domain-containing protein [Bacteroidia bacterium]
MGVMAVLVVNQWVSYGELKDILQLTDGNLASHISALEKLNYVEVKKEFVGKKPQTSYKVTKEGKQAFQGHLDGLEKMIKGI